MAVKNKVDLLDIVQKILNLDSQMRFAAIIDTNGKIREAIMKTGKTSLESQKEEEHFCNQVTDPTIKNHLDERIDAIEKDRKRIREMFPDITKEEWDGNTN